MRALLSRTLTIKQLYKLLGGCCAAKFDAAIVAEKANDRGFVFPYDTWTQLGNLQFAVELEHDGELLGTIRRFLAAVMHDLEHSLWTGAAVDVIADLIDYLSYVAGCRADASQQKIENIIVGALLYSESIDMDQLIPIRIFLRTYLLSLTVFVCYEALVVANLVNAIY